MATHHLTSHHLIYHVSGLFTVARTVERASDGSHLVAPSGGKDAPGAVEPALEAVAAPSPPPWAARGGEPAPRRRADPADRARDAPADPAVADDGRVAAAFGPPTGEIVGQQLLAGTELRHRLVNFFQLVLARLALLLRPAQLSGRSRACCAPADCQCRSASSCRRCDSALASVSASSVVVGADAPLIGLEARAQCLPVVAGAEFIDGRQASGQRRHGPAELSELGLEHGLDRSAAITGRRTAGAKGLQLRLNST